MRMNESNTVQRKFGCVSDTGPGASFHQTELLQSSLMMRLCLPVGSTGTWIYGCLRQTANRFDQWVAGQANQVDSPDAVRLMPSLGIDPVRRVDWNAG